MLGDPVPPCNGNLGAALACFNGPSKDVIDDLHCISPRRETALADVGAIQPQYVPLSAEVSHHLQTAQECGQLGKVMLVIAHTCLASPLAHAADPVLADGPAQKTSEKPECQEVPKALWEDAQCRSKQARALCETLFYAGH